MKKTACINRTRKFIICLWAHFVQFPDPASHFLQDDKNLLVNPGDLESAVPGVEGADPIGEAGTVIRAGCVVLLVCSLAIC